MITFFVLPTVIAVITLCNRSALAFVYPIPPFTNPGHGILACLLSKILVPDKKNLLSFFTALQICKAQYFFTNRQKQDRLGGNHVLSSYKDGGDGFMWFGTTTGPNRFGGAGFKQYKQLGKKTGAASGEIVTSICGMDEDTMWVGAKSGLFLFDKQQDSF